MSIPRNAPQVIDALGDILYVVYGAGSAFGVDLDKAFFLVHESNMYYCRCCYCEFFEAS